MRITCAVLTFFLFGFVTKAQNYLGYQRDRILNEPLIQNTDDFQYSVEEQDSFIEVRLVDELLDTTIFKLFIEDQICTRIEQIFSCENCGIESFYNILEQEATDWVEIGDGWYLSSLWHLQVARFEKTGNPYYPVILHFEYYTGSKAEFKRLRKRAMK